MQEKYQCPPPKNEKKKQKNILKDTLKYQKGLTW